MNISVSKIRYYLEFISFPMFFLLITHLVGHGILLIFSHDHEHHHDHHHESGHGWFETMTETIFTTETLIGVVGALIIMAIWQKTKLKKLIPCNHEHCSTASQWLHIASIAALCLHFFPEAFLRKELIENTNTHTIAQIGFSSHLLIDILVSASISSFFKQNWQKALSFTTIVASWFLAFWVAQSMQDFHVPNTVNTIIHLGSAFLLGMFLHIPHKPNTQTACTNC